MMDGLGGLIALPIGLGLLGFIEPCTIGSSLLFLHYLEGRTPGEKAAQTLTFTAVRGLVMGALGVIAVIVGAVFVDFQKGAWAVMGVAYLVIGAAYLTGQVEAIKRPLGVGLRRLEGAKGAFAIGVVFAFNIPACAGPLLAMLLGTAAVAQANSVGRGFLMMTLFGLALSLPIIVAVLSRRGRALLDSIARHSKRAPLVIGAIFVILGIWSIRFALVAEVI